MVDIEIMLVDDEEDVLDLSKIYLERMNEKYKITAANSAEKALNLLEQNDFDVIISDYDMEPVNGLELLSTIRETGKTTPFIIFTGKGREEVAIQALNLGADFYLQKGGTTESQFHELENLVDKLFEKKQADKSRKHLLDQQISINQLALILGDTRDLDRIYLTIYRHIFAIMDADVFVVSFYDKEREMISPDFAKIGDYDLDMQMFPSRPIHHKESEIQSNVITSGNPIYLEDLRKGQTRRDDGDYSKSAVYVPMKIGGETIGVMEVQSYKLNAYSEQDIQLLSALANVAANSIQNARLFQLQEQMNIELLEEKERTQRYLDLVEVVILVLDLDGNVQMINKKGCSVLAYSEEEIIGKNWFDHFLSENDRLTLKLTFQEILESREPISYGTNDIITKDGTHRKISWRTSILFDNKKNIIGILNSGIDVTEQEKFKFDLQESQQRYQRMAEFVSDGLRVIENGKVVYVNDKACEIFGYPREELLKINIDKLLAPDEVERVSKIFQEAEQTKIYPTELDFWVFDKDGIKKYIRNSFTYSFEDGKIAHQFVISKDITEQKLAEIALRTSESYYRSTIDSITDPMHVIDRNLTIILTNYSMANWLNSLKVDSKIKGKTVFEAFPFLDEEIAKEYKQVFETGKTLTTTGITFLKNKEVITETKKIPILEEDKTVRIITIIKDITEEKALEKQILESEQKLRVLFDKSNDGIITYDLKSNILDANQRIIQILGYKKSELLEKKFIQLIDKNYLKIYHECDEILKKDGYCQYNLVLLTKKKKKYPTEISASLIQIGDEKLIQVIIRDIEARFQAEAEKSKFINNLRFLSKTAIELIAMPSEESIYDIVAEKISDLAGDSYVILTSYDEENNAFQAEVIHGISKRIKKVASILGRDPTTYNFPVSLRYLENRQVGRITKEETDLHELTNGSISKSASQSISSLLNFGEMFSTIICQNGTILGTMLIIMKKDTKIENIELIEAFINQVSTILVRKKAEKELLESETRFRKIIDASPFGVFVYDLDANDQLIFKSGNEAADEILGIKSSNLIGKTIDEAFPGLIDTEFPDIYRKIAKKGGRLENKQMDYDYGKIKGKYEVDAFQLKSGSTVVLFQDVTESVKIKDEEQKYIIDLAFLSESATDFIGLTQFQDIYRYIAEKVKTVEKDAIIAVVSYNEANDIFTNELVHGLGKLKSFVAKQLTTKPDGFTFEIPKSLKNKIKSHGFRKTDFSINEITSGSISSKITGILRKRLGIEEIYIAPFISDGKLFGVIGVMKKEKGELTNETLLNAFINQASIALLRRHAEVSLLASEERYRELVETMNDGLGVDDRNGLFVYANPKLCEMLGYNPEELIGKPVIDFLDEDSKEIYTDLNQIKNDPRTYELDWITKDDRKIPTLVSPKVFWGKNNEYQGSFAVIIDISERKRIEKQLQEQQDTLQIQNNELISYSRFVAHEIRNKLQVLVMANYNKNHELISNSIKKMEEFVEDIIDLARKGDVLGETKSVNLNTLINQIYTEIKSLDPELQIEINPLPILRGNETLLTRAFDNILTNIYEHAEASKVILNSVEERDFYKITIEDNGIGIPEDERLAIINSWDTMIYDSIGMLIVYKFISAHNGKLYLESEEGKGTKVIIHLPKRIN
ncbi:MAG: PAS domain S-box protein [Asgard group archaeon]|nr:PAS domain S-box protein [Asgard group archaeon]